MVSNGDYEVMHKAYGEALSRILALEAELAVRDNCANEVLRILREATGKRDFHSEMEAAEYAAELIRAGGWRPIAEAPEGAYITVGRCWFDEWETSRSNKVSAVLCEFTHYLPEPEPPAREVAR